MLPTPLQSLSQREGLPFEHSVPDWSNGKAEPSIQDRNRTIPDSVEELSDSTKGDAKSASAQMQTISGTCPFHASNPIAENDAAASIVAR